MKEFVHWALIISCVSSTPVSGFSAVCESYHTTDCQDFHTELNDRTTSTAPEGSKEQYFNFLQSSAFLLGPTRCCASHVSDFAKFYSFFTHCDLISWNTPLYLGPALLPVCLRCQQIAEIVTASHKEPGSHPLGIDRGRIFRVVATFQDKAKHIWCILAIR